ncbi:hypothetical protein M8J77_010377 [Diaphorina citri]|nr:hypothetical protein M8J77_010377 [Diaphorina citri]
MVDFYRRFISRASDTLATVSDLLINNIKGNTLIQWTPDAIKAFQHCKEQLAAATLLAHPKDDAPLSLDHHSPSLSSQGNYQQRRRSTAHTTLLAIYLAVKHFRHMIEGRVFTIYTDHKPLTFAFLQKPEKCSPRQFRHLDFIPSFSTDIQYVPGSQNVVADALSRVDAIHATLDYKSLATSQQTDEELKMPESDVRINCDVSTPTARPFITRPFRRTAFNSIHQLSHPSVNTMVKLVKERYVWPSISKDFRTWTRICMDCQRAKVTRHVHAPLGSFSPPTRRFEHVHLDMIIMPHSDGFRYCPTMVDRFTRWPEVIPLADQEAPTVAKAFYTHWIARFSVSQRTKAVNSSPPYSRNSAHSPAPTISAPRLTTLQPMEWSSNFIDSSWPQSSATTQTAGLTFSPLYYSASEQLISRHPVQNHSDVYGEPLRLPGEFLASKADLR